jgi:hypothetical protein
VADYGATITNIQDSSQGLLVRATDNDTSLYLLNLQSSNSTTGQTWVDRFAVTKGGNVGIGTASPDTILNIRAASSTLAIDDSQDGTSKISFRPIGTSYIERAALSINYSTGKFSLSAGVSGNGYFQTFDLNGAERMRITSGGDVLVGTANNSPSAGHGLKNYADGRIYCVSSATSNASESYGMYSTGASNYRFYVGWGGTIFATNTTISSLSDARVKENIRDLDSGLDKIMALKPRLFDWKEG